MEPRHKKQSNVKLIAAVVTIIVIAGIILLVDQLKSKNSDNAVADTANSSTANTTPQEQADTTNPTSDSVAATSGTYKDGTYNAAETYTVPSGSEKIEVSITLKDGVVTDSTITNSEGDRDSEAYQDEFTAGYKSQVIGKSISGLKVGAIAGASDTARAFNDAVNDIATKAQS